jgi:hypothetical protein
VRRYYWLLFAGTVLTGFALVSVGRSPRREQTRTAASPEAPAVSISLEIRDGSVIPSSVSVPKDRRVRLRVRNRGIAHARFGLAGYEDRVSPRVIAPGDSVSAEFYANRPGDDFAWLIDGEPGGRFSVTGSHLVEGHR